MSIKPLLYRLFYSRAINAVFRSTIKAVNAVFGTRLRIAVNGRVRVEIKDVKPFNMHLNESSPFSFLYWDNPNEFEFTPLFVKLAKKSRAFLDIGSNIGFYSLIAAQANEGIKVWAFEPSTGPLFFLRKNLAANTSGNCQAVSIALADSTGSIRFIEELNPKYSYLTHHLSGAGTTNANSYFRARKHNDVPSETLDSFVARNGIDAVDLVKIDTEGTEHLILKGGLEALAKFRPVIICEVLHDSNEKEVSAMVGQLGFDIYAYDNGRLKQVQSIVGGDNHSSRNFFFVHPLRKEFIQEFIA